MKMKFNPVPVLSSLGLAAFVLVGCKPKETGQPAPGAEPSGAAPTATAPSPASAAAFNNVMGMLDEGGSVLFYLGTERAFGVAAKKFEAFRGLMDSLPSDDADDEDTQQAKRAMAYIGKAFKRLGVSEIAGVGMSGIAVDDELNRTRMVLHHSPETGKGHMWSLLGGEPHAMFGLDLMTADTVFATSQDLDFGGLWRLIDSEIQGLGIDDVLEDWNDAKQDFEEETGMNIDEVMKSIGGQFSLHLTLDAKEMIQVPGPDDKPMDIPRPDLVVAVAVNDNLIFERIKQEIPEQDSGIKITKADGMERIQGPPVFPPVPSLQPLVAFDGQHIFLASSPAALDRALAVKAGSEPGLAATDKFKKLSSLAATTGNGFTFADSRLGEVAMEIQSRMLADAPEEARKMFAFTSQWQKPSDLYASFENTRYGWVWTAVGHQDPANAILTSVAVVPSAIMAGMLLPALAQAKDKAERIKCVNNLKQVSLALKIYASDSGDLYPFQVPEARGGTKEKAAPDELGDDKNPFVHLMKLKLELGSPKILTCPGHDGVTPVSSFDAVTPDHISYQLRTGKEVDETHPDEVLIWCPIHHNVGLVDGSVRQMTEFDTEQRQAGSWKL